MVDMATAGEEIRNAVSTDRIVFLQTRDDTAGALLQFDNFHAPGGIGPTPHRQPLQEETFSVVRGTLILTVDGSERRYTAGERAVVPPGAVHNWRNAGDEELHLVTEFRPALHFEEIIETIAALSQRGKVDRRGNPDPRQISATLSAYPGEFALATMPMPLQRFLFGPF
jgi:quercetin dioxygenase-like cupin family protein